MSTGYKYPASVSEKDFSLDVRTVTEITYRLVRVKEMCQIRLYPASFYQDSAGGDVDTVIDIERLESQGDLTGADRVEVGVDFFSTDIDQAKSDDITSVEVYKNVVDGVNFDRTNSRNVARQAGTAITAYANYNDTSIVFERTLYPNTDYLIIATVIAGVVDTSDAIIFGTINRLRK